MFDVAFADQQYVLHQRADDRRGERAGLLDRDAFGHGLARAGKALALHGVVHRRISARLHAVDVDGGFQRLRRDGDARNQSAAADGHHQRVERRRALQHLQRHRALAGHHFGIVIRMHEDEILFRRDFLRAREGIRQGRAVEHHPCTEPLGVLDLAERRSQRHHDGGWNAEPSRVIGHALGMIARRHGDDAARPFCGGQRQQLVQRATILERGGELQILEFEPDLAAGDFG